MSDARCICGHSESMHFGGTKEPHRCMKIEAYDPLSDELSRCACREFRPASDSPTPRSEP